MILKLQETLTDKEIKKFKIPNTLQLDNFHAMQYAMCLGAVYKDNNGKYQYLPEYSMGYINSDITPTQLISFCELHKNLIIKDRTFVNRHFTDIYYIKYMAEEKPTLINEFCNMHKNRVDIEITLCDNGHYRIDELHLELSPYTSILGAIATLFSNENVEGINFISTDDNNYYITYYDDYGREKEHKYQSLQYIYGCITNVRLVGCTQIEG